MVNSKSTIRDNGTDYKSAPSKSAPASQDILKSIFSRLPDERLPLNFQQEMMQQIRKEAVRITKRNERLYMLALIAGALFTAGLAVAALLYVGIPQLTIGFPHVSIPSSYIYFGLLVLILLSMDLLLRQRYYKRHAG